MTGRIFRAHDLMGRRGRLSVALILVPVAFGGVALAIYFLRSFGLALEPGLPVAVVIATVMAIGFGSGRLMGVSVDNLSVAVLLWIAVLMIVMPIIFYSL